MSEHLESWAVRLEAKIDKVSVDVAELKAVMAQVDKHDAVIYGNGQPGLVKDVDRLKQWKKSLYWVVGVIGTATVGDLITSFWGKK